MGDRSLADWLAAILVILSLVLASANVMAMLRARSISYRLAMVTQIIALLYVAWLWSQAGAYSTTISVIDGRLAIILVLTIGVFDRLFGMKRGI